VERIDATRHQSDEVGGTYFVNEGGEVAEKCIAVVTFRRKKNTKRETHVEMENTLFCTMTN
jgi:hypothetical protein